MARTARKTAAKIRSRVAVRSAAYTGPRFVRVGELAVREPGRALMWTHTLGSATWQGAQKLVDKLNADKHAGHADWRLPTVEELFCLADRTRSSPAIDTDAFPDTKSDWYWTGTPYKPYSGYAWLVYFNSGNSYNDHRDYSHCVRAVRASQ